MLIDIEKFKENDIRIGHIQEVKNIKFKKNNYIKLVIDFGPEIGLRKTILKASDNIFFDDLTDRQVVGLVNIVPKKITGIISNALLLGHKCQDIGYPSLRVKSARTWVTRNPFCSNSYRKLILKSFY